MSAFWLASCIFTLGLMEDQLKWWQLLFLAITWPIHLGYWVKEKTK
nr:MAG TPA: hypothetical protein [Caudoviricetes sp.]